MCRSQGAKFIDNRSRGEANPIRRQDCNLLAAFTLQWSRDLSYDLENKPKSETMLSWNHPHIQRTGLFMSGHT